MAEPASALWQRRLDLLATPAFLRCVIAASFALHLVLAYTRNVNWDEFFFLSHVYEHLDNRLDSPFQKAHVHAFGWVRHLPGHEMEQLFVLRLLMTGFLAATCYGIYRIARSMTDQSNALVAVFAFMMSGYVFGFGSDFRADPIAAAFLMLALAIVMTAPLSAMHVLFVAVLVAAGLLVTVKAVFYIPAFLGALYWRWREPGRAWRITAAGCLGVALAGALYALHSAGVTPADGRDTTSNLENAWRTVLLENDLFTRFETFRLWVILSAGSVVLIIFGITRSGDRRVSLLLIAFALPFLLTFVFYRNAFDYFLPYIVPPMMVAVAVGSAHFDRVVAKGLCLALMLGTGVGQGIVTLATGASAQRETIAEVHRLFPEPVYYIDQVGMISSFKRATFFMSSWGMQRYRAEGQLEVKDAIARHNPPLLLANRSVLRFAMERPEQPDHPALLRPEDGAALRETYVHYAGPIWLAGREVRVEEDAQTVTLPFPGRYRLESSDSVSVNGDVIAPRDSIEVNGSISVSAREEMDIRLIWDTGAPPLADLTLSRRVFAGFWSL